MGKISKKEKIKMCIASNSFKVSKIEKVANILDIPFVYFSTKPLKRGLKKQKNLTNRGFWKNCRNRGSIIY